MALTVLTLTQVTKSGGNGVYTYSSFTGTTPAIGMLVTFSGFAISGGVNNLTQQLTAVDLIGKTVTVVSASATNETHSGTGTSLALIQGNNSVQNGGGGGNPYGNTAAFTVNTTAGNILFAWVFDTGAGLTTISDTGGNSWTLIDSVLSTTVFANPHVRFKLWYCVAIGGASTVNVAGTNTGFQSYLSISEWQGPLFIDQHSHLISAAGGADPQIGSPVTTLFASEAIISFIGMNDGAFTGGTNGFVVQSNFIGNPNNLGKVETIYALESSTGTYTPEWTLGISGSGFGSFTTSWTSMLNIVSIAITPTTVTLVSGGTTQQYTAIATFQDSSTADITSTAVWASSDATKATISSPGGLATPLAMGTTNITAAQGGVTSNTAVLTVITPEVFISEVQVTITYQNPGNYIYARDLNSWGDGNTTLGANDGQPYSLCEIVIGNITLGQLGGRLFPLQYVCGYFDAVGTLDNGGPSKPDLWVMFNEISPNAGTGFVSMPETISEPPIGTNHPSKSILSLRWPTNMMNSASASQFCQSIQVRLRFEPENAPSTIKAISFGEDQST